MMPTKYRKGNKIIIDGEVAYLRLHRGRIAIIDVEDVDIVRKYTWHYNDGNKGVKTNLPGHPQKKLYLSRFLLFGEEHMTKRDFVDHINHNTLDNRKSNLRPATYRQNNFNKLPQKRGGTSKYKGVSWNKRNKKWVAQIMINRQSIHLGCFTEEIEAAKAYDKKAKELYREFAYLNLEN